MVELLRGPSLGPFGRSNLQKGKQGSLGRLDFGVGPDQVTDQAFADPILLRPVIDVPPQVAQVVHCRQGICCGLLQFAFVYRRSEQAAAFFSRSRNCGLSAEVHVVSVCVFLCAVRAV